VALVSHGNSLDVHQSTRHYRRLHVNPSRTLVAVVCLLVVLAVLPASAQSPDLYAFTHPFALPGSTTTRLAGMGGFVACIQDDGFANPAYAAMLDQSAAVGRYVTTSFDAGLRLTAEQFSIAAPLKPQVRGLQVTGFRLTSNVATLPGLPPVDFSAAEYDVSIHYGERLSPRLAVGVAISPIYHNSVNLVTPAFPPATTFLTASGNSGVRLGAVYDFPGGCRLGAVYDRYKEDVTAVSGLLPFPVTTTYTAEEMVAGISVPLRPWLLGALEWQQMTTDSGVSRVGSSGWRIGFEATLPDGWRLRVGDDQGALCAGLGYNRGPWSARYAYVRDWHDVLVGSLLGSSNTHQFELVYGW
jgi:hypothetical protein